MEFAKLNKTYDFMGKRRQFLFISLILFIASIGILFTKGLNFGIDFSGGTLVQIKYDKKAPINDIRNILKEKKAFANASITEFGAEDEIIIRITTSSNSVTSDISDEINVLLASTGNFEIRRVDIVGPKVGNELREKGIMALGLSLLMILIYVSYRFEFRFAVASIFALVHDIVITLGAIVLFDIEVNLDILAALLTLLGYSLNDTIIVFDRIREGVNTSKETKLESLINESVSKTLSRTTLTSLTTFFVVLILFIFGSEIIYGFSFTLLIGLIIGTYSSIFVASPFLLQLKFSIEKFRNNEAEKLKRQKEKDKLRAMYEQGTV